MANGNDPSQKDAFWDLEALLPKKKGAPRVSDRRQDTDAIELEVSRPVQGKTTLGDVMFEEHPVSPRVAQKHQEPLFSYVPEKSLLREVRVYQWRTQYDYYERFRQHALHFLNTPGTPCPQADFFSYMPQYSQMNIAQMRYYLWWRAEFRAGRILPAAFSYLLLFLYEVINVGEAIPPAEGQALILRLWQSYRAAHPRLDSLAREWLCDYSLLYRLPPPVLPPKELRGMLSGCELKEFYVPIEEGSDTLVSAMLLFCNNYDYTKSKFYTEESAADYHRVLRGAVRVALENLRTSEESPLLKARGVSTISRDTFAGAICSYRVRRRIEVDFTSFSHTHELRYVMSDVLKYAENALRASRGIKSRLSVYALDASLRSVLDAYFASEIPKKPTRVAKKEDTVPEYERRYDLPRTALSLSRAADIEAESWETTQRLVEAFAEEENTETAPNGVEILQESPPAPPPEAQTGEVGLGAALAAYRDFLLAVARADVSAERAFAAQNGMMIDAVVDKINTVSGDIIGDILLEELNGTLVIVEDYKEMLQEVGVL